MQQGLASKDKGQGVLRRIYFEGVPRGDHDIRLHVELLTFIKYSSVGGSTCTPSGLSAHSVAGSVYGTMLMVIGLLLLHGAVGADINIRKTPLCFNYPFSLI